MPKSGNGHNSVNIYKILTKVNHKLYVKCHSRFPAILITMSLMAKMSKTEMGHNSVKYSLHLTKSYPGHLHQVPKLYIRYNDPSSSNSSDILFTKLLYYIQNTKVGNAT